MNILFVHQNFPGQFVHLAADLASQKANRVCALSVNDNPVPAGVTLRVYTMLRAAATETHPLLQDQEAKILRAEACAAAAMQLKREGFVPDLIIAHPGWGESLFMKDAFPSARLAVYCEYYYAPGGQDVGFDPEIPPLTLEQRYRLRLKNTTNLLSLEAADLAISPTEWQKSTFPRWAQRKITVIHDGIDTDRLRYRSNARLTLGSNTWHAQVGLTAGDEVLTYVARHLEPVRGFQVLIRALPYVLAQRPKAQVVIVGGDSVGYGHHAPGGVGWKAHLLEEMGNRIDLSRVHFVGQIPEQTYLDLLSISKVHVYWTTPFVLSWSFLEAALSGVPMVASATPPVLEFSGALGVQTVDFFDTQGFARAIVAKLAAPTKPRQMKEMPNLSVKACVVAQKAWLGLV